MNIFVRLSAIVVVAITAAACSEQQSSIEMPQPVALSEEAVGHYCNMTVLEHTGPKAQIHLVNNPHPIWFSQVRDGIAFIRSPEEQEDAVIVYVNDMGKAEDWDFPGDDTWIDAGQAWFVIGSRRTGSLDAPGPDMLELCSLVSTIHQASAGRFDPSVQPLWTAYARAGGAPDIKTLANARAATGWSKVEISADRIRLQRGAALTFNGIAQGFITDRVVDLLKAQGLEAGLVSVGEIAAVGASPAGSDWAIGLADHEDGPADATIHLRDRAVATSSPRGTLFGPVPAGHILDPETGMAAPPGWRRVSVFHRSAAIADGLSTAGVLQGAKDLRAMVNRFPGAQVRAIDRDGHMLVV